MTMQWLAVSPQSKTVLGLNLMANWGPFCVEFLCGNLARVYPSPRPESAVIGSGFPMTLNRYEI